MKLTVKENRELIMVNARNTQNENDVETLQITVPEKYEDFNKKIVFITDDGVKWDLIENDTYKLQRNITKYDSVKFYIWLTKDEQDFRSIEKTLYFNKNHEVDGEITPEEQTDMERVISILDSEIIKVENLESQVDGKLEEIDTAIDNVNSAIQETENLDLDAEKVNKTTTVTITKKDGTEKSVNIQDGQDLQFMWQGTSLGVKTENQEQYTFVNLQGVQGPAGPQGEPFTIKKTYASISQMNADFNNMQLGDYVMIASTVELEDNAKLYTKGESQWIFITDFSGATGVKGETGLTPNIQIGTVTQGSSFSVTRTGTNENPILNFTLVKGDKGDKGEQGDDYVLTAQDKEEIAEMVDVPVDDVQINGTSIVSNGVANIPPAGTDTFGVAKINVSNGVRILNNGQLATYPAVSSHVKTGTNESRPLVPKIQHESTFYGLAKAAGHDEKNSTLPVGEYSDEAKIAIQKMLGVYQAPWELIEDFTLEEDGGFDKSAELDGTPYNFRSAYVRITVPPNSTSIASGYGRWYFVDGNGTSLTAESGRYTGNSAQMCKTILIERNANMAIAKLNSFTSTGGRGMLGYKNIGGISFDYGNIKRIYTNVQDKEPAGARIEIYAQRA